MRVLNEADPNDTSSILRHSHTFKFGASLVLVFELMDNSLESVIQAHARAASQSNNIEASRNAQANPSTSSVSPRYTASSHTPSPRLSEQKSFVPMKHLRLIAAKMLSALAFCERLGIIHADLKPENILLTIPPDEEVEIEFKICDFGNAMFVEDIHAYFETFELQSLYYRAPEVIMGMNFTTQIDLWSLGCTLCELFTGKPLFLCLTKEHLIGEMIKTLGPMPRSVFANGRLFKNYITSQGKLRNDAIVIPFPQAVYDAVVVSSAEMHQLSYDLLSEALKTTNHNFLNFILGLLTYDPAKRFTPIQALSHPFIGSLFPSGLFNAFRMDLDSHHRLRANLPQHPGQQPQLLLSSSSRGLKSSGKAPSASAGLAFDFPATDVTRKFQLPLTLWTPTEAQKLDIDKTMASLSFRMSLLAPPNAADKNTITSYLYQNAAGLSAEPHHPKFNANAVLPHSDYDPSYRNANPIPSSTLKNVPEPAEITAGPVLRKDELQNSGDTEQLDLSGSNSATSNPSPRTVLDTPGKENSAFAKPITQQLRMKTSNTVVAKPTPSPKKRFEKVLLEEKPKSKNSDDEGEQRPTRKRPAHKEDVRDISSPFSEKSKKSSAMTKELLKLTASASWFDSVKSPFDEDLNSNDRLLGDSSRRSRRLTSSGASSSADGRGTDDEKDLASATEERHSVPKSRHRESLNLDLSEVKSNLAAQNEEEARSKVPLSQTKRVKGTKPIEVKLEDLSSEALMEFDSEPKKKGKGKTNEPLLETAASHRSRRGYPPEYDIFVKGSTLAKESDSGHSREHSIESESSSLTLGDSHRHRPQRNRLQPTEWWRSGVELIRARDANEGSVQSELVGNIEHPKNKKAKRENVDEDLEFQKPAKKPRKE